MTIDRIDEVKDQLNTWNKSFWDNLERILLAIHEGEASDEEIAVVGAGSMIECFQGWQFQLPSTKSVFEFKGEPKLDIYEWAEDIDWDTVEPVVWKIRDDHNIPNVAKRLLDEFLV